MRKTAVEFPANREHQLATAGNAPAQIDEFAVGHGFHYWQGASGERYLHSVYPLSQCPELPKANYIIVQKRSDGRRAPLRFGQTLADTGPLNLARIRQAAARLGADEIHIHVLTEGRAERAEVEKDLLAAQYQRLETRLQQQAANDVVAPG